MSAARYLDGKQRSSSRLITALTLHSKLLFTRHGINKEILSCFLEKRSIVLQRAVNSVDRIYISDNFQEEKTPNYQKVQR